jgi:hypothetical protein
VLERLQQVQAQGYGHVPLGQLVLALVIGLVIAPLSALAHEYGHALAARRYGLVGVALPRLDRGRFAWRLGCGLSRVLSARDGRGWVRLDPAVEPRHAVRILAAGPAAEVALAAVLVVGALALHGAGSIQAVLALGALDCVAGAVLTVARREGGYGDGAQLRAWRDQAGREPAGRPRWAHDRHEATSVAPPVSPTSIAPLAPRASIAPPAPRPSIAPPG